MFSSKRSRHTDADLAAQATQEVLERHRELGRKAALLTAGLPTDDKGWNWKRTPANLPGHESEAFRNDEAISKGPFPPPVLPPKKTLIGRLWTLAAAFKEKTEHRPAPSASISRDEHRFI